MAIISTNMTDEQVERFERLPEEQQVREIGIAMFAKLKPWTEWFTFEEYFEIRGDLAGIPRDQGEE